MTRLLSLILCSSALAADPAVTPKLVRGIIAIESSGRAGVTGDSGAARGLAQFHLASWLDTGVWRAARGLPTYPYSYAYDAACSQAYLHSWLELNAARFRKATGRTPTPADLYAIHNLGFKGYAQRSFDFARCPSITKRKAAHLR
jgi:hypothetical protein